MSLMTRWAKAASKVFSRTDSAGAEQKSLPIPRNVVHLDGIENPETGLGRPVNRFVGRPHKSFMEADCLYSFSSLMAKIIDLIPETCFAKGFGVNEISGDDATALEDYLTGLDAFRELTNAARWAGLYGGSIVVMTINDGRQTDEPVDINRIESLNSIQVFDSTEAYVKRYICDVSSPSLGYPEIYTISTYGKTLDVHFSRVLHFDGVPISRSQRHRMNYNRGFSSSIVDRVWDSFSAYGATNAYFSKTIEKLTQGVLKLSNLNEGLETANSGKIRNRLRMLIMSMSTIGDIVIDKDGEGYEVNSRNVQGFADANNVFIDWLVAESNISRSILMGQTRGGIADGNNDGDWKSLASTCGSRRTNVYEPLVHKLIGYIFASRNSPVMDPPSKFTVYWPPILEMSEADKAQIYSLRAPGRASDIASGVISAIQASRSDDVIETYHLDAEDGPGDALGIDLGGETPDGASGSSGSFRIVS